jgi:preprotein translocase SecE subunit
VARDRKSAKERQAQRRAQRLAEGGGGILPDPVAPAGGVPPQSDDGSTERPDIEPSELEARADLEVGAPPEDVGFSERTLAHAPPGPDSPDDLDDDEDDWVDPDAGDGASGTAVTGPRGVRGGGRGTDPARHGRVIAFLVACWAELKRVQWPDRKQLTQLTGVVLFFVLIVGLYLGGLDAVFSRLIQAIL